MGLTLPKNYKITKLDGRHTGNKLFSHYINYNVYVRGGHTSISNNEINFLRARVWFWEKFGPSCELGKYNQVNHITEYSPDWAWQTEHNLLRIYVREKALNFFLLTHSA
jgi:hypothetical protein